MIGALLAVALTLAAGAIGTDPAVGRAATTCAGVNLNPGPTDGPAIEAATVCLIDQVRAAHHLRPLRSNGYLQLVAAAQVSAMVRANYFADIRPTGETPWLLIARTPYAAHARISAGQNLGWATAGDATPLGMVTAWMNSPPHRQIILSGAFRDLGVGVTAALPSVLGQGSEGAIYAVEFGARVLVEARRGAPKT
jgi:uncharacterized protein YkwD